MTQGIPERKDVTEKIEADKAKYDVKQIEADLIKLWSDFSVEADPIFFPNTPVGCVACYKNGKRAMLFIDDEGLDACRALSEEEDGLVTKYLKGLR